MPPVPTYANRSHLLISPNNLNLHNSRPATTSHTPALSSPPPSSRSYPIPLITPSNRTSTPYTTTNTTPPLSGPSQLLQQTDRQQDPTHKVERTTSHAQAATLPNGYKRDFSPRSGRLREIQGIGNGGGGSVGQQRKRSQLNSRGVKKGNRVLQFEAISGGIVGWACWAGSWVTSEDTEGVVNSWVRGGLIAMSSCNGRQIGRAHV